MRAVTPVTVLAERLEDFASRLDADQAEELRAIAALAGGLDDYLARSTTPESFELQLLAERTRATDWGDRPVEAEMLSGHVEGQFLKALVHLARARRVLEIGMFTGYAALAMAEALPEDGVVIACELDPDVAALGRDCIGASPHGHKVDVRVGPADKTLVDLAGERFDLVFLDADKAGYTDYLDALLDGDLLEPHALVCVDNTLMQGEPWTGTRTPNGEAIAAFNERVAADPRVEQVLLPLRDGLTLIRLAP